MNPRGLITRAKNRRFSRVALYAVIPARWFKRNKNQLCEYMTAESAHLVRIPAQRAGNFPCNHTRRSSPASKVSDRTVGSNAHAHCSQSLCKPGGSQFRSQRLSSFWLAPRITDHWKNPNKPSCDWPINHHIQISLQIQKPWERWFDFDRSFVCTQVYQFTSMSHETTLQWHFVKKISFLLFSKGFFIPFITNAERQLPVPLDKGNGGSGDETGRLRDKSHFRKASQFGKPGKPDSCRKP